MTVNIPWAPLSNVQSRFPELHQPPKSAILVFLSALLQSKCQISSSINMPLPACCCTLHSNSCSGTNADINSICVSVLPFWLSFHSSNAKKGGKKVAKTRSANICKSAMDILIQKTKSWADLSDLLRRGKCVCFYQSGCFCGVPADKCLTTLRLRAEFKFHLLPNFNSVILSIPFSTIVVQPPLSPQTWSRLERRTKNEERDTGEQLKHHFMSVEQWPCVV